MPKLAERKPLQHRKCPKCKEGNLVTIATFTARGPPSFWLEQIKKQVNKVVIKRRTSATGNLWPKRKKTMPNP